MSHTFSISSPCAGALSELRVKRGDSVTAGDVIAIVEIMKMQQEVTAPSGGEITAVHVRAGAVVQDGQLLIELKGDGTEAVSADKVTQRQSLQKLRRALAATGDAARPEAVSKRKAKGGRTARENLSDLLDENSFCEYGGLAIAAQRRRRDMEDLITNTPADGIVTGTGAIDGERVAVLAYDYTVLAGTQGYFNHRKSDRVLELAQRENLPVIFYTEGGGGRPGDVDLEHVVLAGLNVPTFASFARCKNLRIAVNHGRCFAGNAVLFGTADITIATKTSNIGMAGPAMIAGAGLGHVTADEIGPADLQSTNGVIDVLAEDEADATAKARQVLGYFTHPDTEYEAGPAEDLRDIVPENRNLGYDMRKVIEALCDQDSVLELGRGWADGMITALVRIQGRAMGLYANNPLHLAGAIDAQAADKAARFLTFCGRFDLPVLSLCDTPGFMVGPEYETPGTVRKTTAMLQAAANLLRPVMTVVTRKGYGLGAMAMAGGGFGETAFTISWPTGEFGAMGLEGAVRLGFRKELEAESDPDKRQALFDRLLAQQYEAGRAINMARTLELDAVIDPAETRDWISRAVS